MATEKHFVLTIHILIFFCVVFSGLQLSLAQQDGVVVYSNSFESPKDTAGMQFYGMMKFSSDVPSGGGKQSLYISGGCIWPHAQAEVGPFEQDGFYILRCWGKDLQIGGGVSIGVEGNYSRQAYVNVNKKEWTFYQSSEKLFCPAGKKIMLSMGAGGIISSSMLVDKLEVVRVDNVTSVSDKVKNTASFYLFQNYPNPFNPSTRIRYEILKGSKVVIKIFNLLGSELMTLYDSYQEAGKYEIQWNGLNFPSGTYFYVIKAGNSYQAKKMILAK